MRHTSGQVLLIVIMLITTAFTVVLATSFKSSTETQVTKLEEESQKALAAAEAGIEAALKQGNVAINDTNLNVPAGFSGQATVDKTSFTKDFSTPLLQKDEQYAFYLAQYDIDATPPTFTNPFTGSLDIYYGSEGSCDNIVLELSLVYDDGVGNYDVEHLKADKVNKLGGKNSSDVNKYKSDSSYPFKGSTYSCYAQLNEINNGKYPNRKILFVRSLFAPTKVLFCSTSNCNTGGNSVPPQGKYVSSQASSSTGVSKSVELFQSNPQIPAEFFVTRFQ